ncbi:MAG: ParB/RepB/Spo0J family partition protein [Gammaproteobacteria bacterium]
MSQKKPTLGRSLAALLPNTFTQVPPAAGGGAPETRGSPALAPGDELAKLPLDLLQRGKYQPRLDMRQETLQELADSIKAQGVVQPIVVRPVGMPVAGQSQRYEIVAGERRWRASQLAGLSDIPAIIRHIPDEAAIAVALIENIQREDLNSLEEARALDRLINEFQLTHQQCADAIGRSRAAVSNLLRLLEAAPEVCEMVAQHALEMGHARALLGITNKRRQAEVAATVAKKGMSVRDTEALVRRVVGASKGEAVSSGTGPGSSADEASTGASAATSDPNVSRLEQELAEKLGAKVTIEHASSGKGKVVVTYNSLDELDGILAHIQ